MMMDTLANAMAVIKNAESVGKQECVIYPASKLIAAVLNVMRNHGYIESFEYIYDGRGGKLVVKLLGRINNCGVIKPRFPVRKDAFDQWERMYLPSRDIGILIVSTPQGVMSHREAKEKGIGGVLLAYVY
uniref:Small ribosomal subunit protein uS8 n=1 Tax=Thermofilum pendens TaxID=2269 RepID=A0A7C3SNV2_THEPE